MKNIIKFISFVLLNLICLDTYATDTNSHVTITPPARNSIKLSCLPNQTTCSITLPKTVTLATKYTNITPGQQKLWANINWTCINSTNSLGDCHTILSRSAAYSQAFKLQQNKTILYLSLDGNNVLQAQIPIRWTCHYSNDNIHLNCAPPALIPITPINTGVSISIVNPGNVTYQATLQINNLAPSNVQLRPYQWYTVYLNYLPGEYAIKLQATVKADTGNNLQASCSLNSVISVTNNGNNSFVYNLNVSQPLSCSFVATSKPTIAKYSAVSAHSY